MPVWCYTYLDILQKKDILSLALNYCVPITKHKVLLTRSDEFNYNFISEDKLEMRSELGFEVEVLNLDLSLKE